jgi:hypothetical protein
VLSDNPVIVILLAFGFNTSFLILSGNAIAVYPIIGECPVYEGAVNLTFALVFDNTVTVPIVGALGANCCALKFNPSVRIVPVIII